MTDVTISLSTDRREFESLLRVRRAVFVEEQGGPALDEPDAWDEVSTHFAVRLEEEFVGTARLSRVDTWVGKIGRVSLLPDFRGQGHGARLMAKVMDHAAALGLRTLVLHAQVDAVEFYLRLGFHRVGAEFEEGGIPHLKMVKELATGRTTPAAP